jgi:hypothetical protein
MRAVVRLAIVAATAAWVSVRVAVDALRARRCWR